MLLKSLELQGFKSFPDKTKIEFGKGLTAVVGPNGSGKSNLSDAMRWVMGEQSTKTLRGSKMEDVIFTGTQQRKSQGFAQVSLTIDNSDRSLAVDSDEVIITRRLNRNGDSEYKINHASVRLKDINELLMDTGLGRDGYALVGQGRIAEIIQSKSDQRREIFEEAAGISKFRYRKNEAVHKLEASEENLLRLQDILSELEQRVEPLKKQSEKAKAFLQLSQEKRQLEVALWNLNLDQTSQKLKEQEDKILACQVEHEDLQQSSQALEEKINQSYEEMQRCLSRAEDCRQEKEELEQQNSALLSQEAVGKNNLEHFDQETARLSQQLEDFKRNQQQTGRLLQERQRQRENLEAALEETNAKLEAAQGQLAELAKQDQGADQQSAQLSKRINELLLLENEDKLTVIQLTGQTEEDANSYQNNQIMLSQMKDNAQGTQRELKQAQELAQLLTQRMETLENQKAGYRFKLEGRQKKLEQEQAQAEELLRQAGQLRQKAKLLRDLEDNLEGFAYSVKAVMKQSKNGRLEGIHGTVARLLQVPEEYALAIETALGGSMQHIVVENENAAKSAIRFLKQQNAGRATFLPLTSVKGRELTGYDLTDQEGYVDLASHLVKADAQYQGIVDSLLGRIVVAEDLDCAAAMGRQFGYRFKIVTLDGQVVNAGGSFSGGSKSRSAGLLSRAGEITQLQQQAEALTQRSQQQSQDTKKLEQEVNTLKAQLGALESEQITVKEDRIRCEGEQKRLEALEAEYSRRVQEMEQELEGFLQRLQEKNQKIANLRRRQGETQRELEQAQQTLQSLRGQGDLLRKQREEVNASIQQLQLSQLAQQKDVDSLLETMEQLMGQSRESEQLQQQLARQIQQLGQQRTQQQQQIQQCAKQRETNRLTQQKLEEQVQRILQQRTQLEQAATGLREEEKQYSRRREEVSRRLAQLEERRDTLQKEYDEVIRKLWEEYELTRSQARQEAQQPDDPAKAKTRLAAVKGEIRSLGSVNLSAIEEYEEVSQRYEFMSRQLADVEQSRKELEDLIKQLTRKMEELFAQSFEEINQNFQKIFVDLFGGGHGELKLTDPEDLLGSGIEIIVQPPGKVIRHLSALSGGEQSFVAIAIYFAILKVRPAPFCILDEIEAALDDVNVARYAEYLRLMSDKTQFIAITHRRGTMEEADVLYGVTMQEKGVSKLLKLDVSEVAGQSQTA
ncbi:MAG TPA: chromosome segregation protein SMC [Candidatus Egerieicola faecale]|uniref:Chromosome partition protein Smc n=1 Tax=Candidatus Egerieicola faecale TaxID=2840774 RepID=A0A9D1IQG2_9FIRM|nr:chromosome segregation protein SMC [Candidatus Egerieicola faecale]